MKITSRQHIAGYPALQVQKFIRRYRFRYIDRSEVRKCFLLDSRKATAFLDEMADLGYLVLFSLAPNGKPTFELSKLGQALADASTAKPVEREEADHLLDEFMDRVRKINADDQYAVKVGRVALFGDMLKKGTNHIEDVGLALEVIPATSDFQKLKLLCWYRRHVARATGWDFETTCSWMNWPKFEVFYVLKMGLKNLSLHELKELYDRKDTPYKVLYVRRGQ